MLASAFCGALLFAAGLYGYFYWQLRHLAPGEEIRMPARNETIVPSAPPIVETPRFFGSHGVYASEFSSSARDKVLAAGPGRLVGTVTVDGKPLEGLRLRLALNGEVMSQWAISAADGRYEVPVPYGRYRIDGYELDSSVANKILPGKVDGPRRGIGLRDTQMVAAGRSAEGPRLAFVEPVKKLGPDGDVRLSQPVVIRWQPYPGATAYRIQLIEQGDVNDYSTRRQLFEWRARPVVTSTSLDLSDYKIALKKGYLYTAEIEALGEHKQQLSQSPSRFGRADFRAVE